MSSGILYMIKYEFVECVHILQILLIRHIIRSKAEEIRINLCVVKLKVATTSHH